MQQVGGSSLSAQRLQAPGSQHGPGEACPAAHSLWQAAGRRTGAVRGRERADALPALPVALGEALAPLVSQKEGHHQQARLHN